MLLIVLLLCLLCLLWAIFATKMDRHIHPNFPISEYIFCFALNFIFCPIAMAIAIKNFDSHMKE